MTEEIKNVMTTVSNNQSSTGDNKRRVVVTGIGAITTIGSGADGLWAGVKCARSAVGPITRFDASELSCRIAGEIHDFDPSIYLDGKPLKRLDRCSQFAVAAGKQAVEDSGLDLASIEPHKIGVCIGSALGGAAYAEEQHTIYVSQGMRGISPQLAFQMFVGASSCNVSILLGLTGFNSSNADSCASGTIAIGNSWNIIKRGDADVMLCGASDAPLAPLCFGAFALIRAMSTRNDDPAHACSPFDKNRDGFVMAEGAAILMLEEREHAIQRGAHIYCEITGYATYNDAHHMTAPRPDGTSAARCVSEAVKKAGILPEQIDYINAHGSSTTLNDSTETIALKLALGEEAVRKIPISSTKAMHAHALGASGAIEAAICCLAMENSWIPPTISLQTPDPECDLDFVPNVGRSKTLNTVVSNSFGFGGINAALVFQKP